MQKALPLFQDGGSILLNASITASKGTEAFSVCSSPKAAMRSFACCWTVDPKGRKIRINALSAGPIDTPGLSNLAPTEERKGQLTANLAASAALGRAGSPAEVAKAAVCLASDDGSCVTGIDPFVDGGMAQI